MKGCFNERDNRGSEKGFEGSALGNWAYGARRALAVLLALLLTSSLVVGRAYAYYAGEEVILSDIAVADGGSYDVLSGYMVIAYSNWRAALLALGYSVTDSRLTNDATAKLSNASTGGSFYEYAQTFLTKYQLGGELPPWTFGSADFVNTWETIAGTGTIGPYMDIFYSTADRSLIANAKRDLETILNGGDLVGGGGAGDGDTEYVTFYGNVQYIDNSYTSHYFKDVSGVRYSNNVNSSYSELNTPLTVRVKDIGQFHTFLETYKVTDYKYYCYLFSTQAQDTIGTFYVLALSNAQNNLRENTLAHVGTEYIYNVTFDNRYTFAGNNMPYTFDNNVITIDPSSVSTTITNVAGTSFRPNSAGLFFERGNGQSGPSVPPTNWPDAPTVTAPTAPEVPEPTQPTTDPQPVAPSSPTIPVYAPQVTYPDVTYVEADISAILDALNEHCQHLQSAIYQGFSDYFDVYTPWLSTELQTLRNFLGSEDNWIVNSISLEFDSLKDYLEDLAAWLAGQLDFDVGGGGYDDSSVVAWLKRIYLKLGNGSVDTRPVDPVADGDGAWDWIWQFIQDILAALAGGAAALTGTVGGLFDGIKDKFPFSIPWDVVAIVTLLDAAPQTPAFTIAYEVFGTSVRYDIDLHFFDDYVGVVRAMENILFCAYLLFKTDWLSNVFDGAGRYLGRKLGYG